MSPLSRTSLSKLLASLSCNNHWTKWKYFLSTKKVKLIIQDSFRQCKEWLPSYQEEAYTLKPRQVILDVCTSHRCLHMMLVSQLVFLEWSLEDPEITEFRILSNEKCRSDWYWLFYIPLQTHKNFLLYRQQLPFFSSRKQGDVS